MAEQHGYFMGQDGFVWFVGVVEDRDDPERIGRVRVRCLGFHTEDLDKLPTADLPWAHVMHPVTDPSMHGMGNTPSFLVEGAWVVGFFRDAYEKQQPVIIGSLPGTPAKAATHTTGFNDPRSPLHPDGSKQLPYARTPKYGPYPLAEDQPRHSGHAIGESDTNRLAQGEVSEEHGSLIRRRLMRMRGDPTKVDTTIGVDDNADATKSALSGKNMGTGIPIATQPYLKQTSTAAVQETREWWDEPDPKSIKKYAAAYASGQYPYNHVHESESGHIHEIDDTKGGERLYKQHMSGTFEEIHPDGAKVVKILGNNYEIIVGDSNVAIFGDVNITTTGTVRELIKGDYILEVEGNYTQKIHKNHRVKIGAGTSGGNREEEIRGNHASQINGDVKSRITGNIDTIIEKSETRFVNDYSWWSVQNDIHIASTGPVYTAEGPKIGEASGNIVMVANNNLSTTTLSGITSFKSGDKLNMKSADAMVIKSETTMATTTMGVHTIDYNGDAHVRYDADYYKHVGADTFLFVDVGVNHTQTVPKTRTGAVDVTETTVNNLEDPPAED